MRSVSAISGEDRMISAILASIFSMRRSKTTITLFLDDGRVAIDNSPAERAIRPVVLGRKNFLFAGSDAGGETLADAMTIIETAKLQDLNPQAYLADILGRINDHKINALDELLPWNWQPAEAALIVAAA